MHSAGRAFPPVDIMRVGNVTEQYVITEICRF